MLKIITKKKLDKFLRKKMEILLNSDKDNFFFIIPTNKDNNLFIFLINNNNDDLLGYIYCSKNNYIEVISIFIHPKYRNRGYCKILLDFLTNFYNNDVMCCVVLDDDKLGNLLLKKGWKKENSVYFFRKIL